MKVAIDRTGRIVVPKKVREQYNLIAGSELDLTTDADGIHLKKLGSEPTLVERRGFLVHHGSGEVDIDIGRFINAERESRAVNNSNGSHES